MENVYGITWITYDETRTFDNFDDASKLKEKDFSWTSSDLFHYFQQGINNVAVETRNNGGPSTQANQNSQKTVAKKGGRLGNAATRSQIEDIATELKSRGYRISGGGKKAEEFLPHLGGARKGGSYLDLTAVHSKYPTLRINTYDVLKDGITPTARESRNAARIRTQIGQGEHLLLIPKR